MDETREQDESVENEVAEEPTEAPGETDDSFDPERAKAKISKANREAEGLRKRLKELEPLANKARELEEASKTDLQRLQEEAGTHKDRAIKAESELSKIRKAIELAPEGTDVNRIMAVAKRASGDDEEALAADVSELFELLAPSKGAPSSKPKEKLRGGGDPDEEPEDLSPEKLASRIPRF